MFFCDSAAESDPFKGRVDERGDEGLPLTGLVANAPKSGLKRDHAMLETRGNETNYRLASRFTAVGF